MGSVWRTLTCALLSLLVSLQSSAVLCSSEQRAAHLGETWELPRRALLQEVQQHVVNSAAESDSPSPVAPSGGDSPAVVATDAAKAPSDCVPANTVIMVWANRHHRPLFSAQIKNVQHRDCFMSRFVFVALDGFMYAYCQELARDGIKMRCARSTTTTTTTTGYSESQGRNKKAFFSRFFRSAEDKDTIDLHGTSRTTDQGEDGPMSPDDLANHMSSRWKEVSEVLSSDNNVWAFDVDVVMLDVPNFAEAMGMETTEEGNACDVLYQRRAPQTKQMVLAALGEDGDTSGLRGGVTGQMFLRANDKASQILLAAAQRRDSRENGDGAAAAGVDDSVVFETGEIERRVPGIKACALPETYASSCWGMRYDAVTFHANCVYDDGSEALSSAAEAGREVVKKKLKVLHAAMDDHSRHRSEVKAKSQTGGTGSEEEEIFFTCWKNGVRCDNVAGDDDATVSSSDAITSELGSKVVLTLQPPLEPPPLHYPSPPSANPSSSSPPVVGPPSSCGQCSTVSGDDLIRFVHGSIDDFCHSAGGTVKRSTNNVPEGEHEFECYAGYATSPSCTCTIVMPPQMLVNSPPPVGGDVANHPPPTTTTSNENFTYPPLADASRSQPGDAHPPPPAASNTTESTPPLPLPHPPLPSPPYPPFSPVDTPAATTPPFCVDYNQFQRAFDARRRRGRSGSSGSTSTSSKTTLLEEDESFTCESSEYTDSRCTLPDEEWGHWKKSTAIDMGGGDDLMPKPALKAENVVMWMMTSCRPSDQGRVKSSVHAHVGELFDVFNGGTETPPTLYIVTDDCPEYGGAVCERNANKTGDGGGGSATDSHPCFIRDVIDELIAQHPLAAGRVRTFFAKTWHVSSMAPFLCSRQKHP